MHESTKPATEALPSLIPIEIFPIWGCCRWRAAFCAGQTTIDFFYIHPDDIAAHHLPPWLIGCNAAGEPQHEAAKILKNRGKEDLMRKDTVPVLSFATLVEQYVAF